ncbi:D-isomer specific 2-hydroxyacid dehydrogenase NAD-binding protein OS=Tsukamurella paurometabola (strain ATCC 8368 / DSM / CCUG 35730 / CIP 100753 / JCM 10117 / KCTC 9821 / NBRC 16120 / NCIMB 702349 / NCTC 13040)OX=521096 GN=Tpau_0524 PE=3 SV=1 [Tsukamurella paurometabola]|uniref:D-isomer specific 2-hydroxyacid dehydrogenase NAD-binding protein n=1 Tax=Tsukamurella paurometabola (strain ATCC 8368 / DSM 20162 / CCUG 35730 / CIP 100753 / JCM 10117 / KCTC 9821 / NBRC 16120 / NCIMB 702349 / NCTC 13040) TaxID=521096 RepID=D5US98_TSUPD|nr:D-isomer specific 2-hydroxyacid dehydrogenase family protein [Tsukamurella paurometabola]ADG77165.1 D-isomer specific 2-hydroxyacid dehydrogenase NAD-binding protein [Tsukamurella paurometabola DSM 20162]SUP43009.1 D-specific alpha-keto acid dehydrogenase [Tsukamurella paurometabola]
MTQTTIAPLAARAPRPTGITVYGCADDEAALFRKAAPRWGIPLIITELPLSEENVMLAFGRRTISVGHRTPVTHPVLLALSRIGVRYVSTRSAGFDHIDVEYAAQLGITVGNVDYSPDSVADYTLMLMLMAIRDAKAVMRRTDSHDYRLSRHRGRELRDLTVGVIGAGRIGSAVVERLTGFGCRVLTADTRPGDDHVSLDHLLASSDIITLHTPLTADTHHLLDAARIHRMRPGAIVVNTGRGALIDTDALVDALEAGHLGGAALDVLEGEHGIFYTDRRDRPVQNSALLRLQHLPNAIISPHAAYFTDHALRDTVHNSLLNCLTFEENENS